MIEEAPYFGAELNTEYILGMAKAGDGIKNIIQ
jgi:hypothetical protein